MSTPYEPSRHVVRGRLRRDGHRTSCDNPACRRTLPGVWLVGERPTLVLDRAWYLDATSKTIRLARRAAKDRDFLLGRRPVSSWRRRPDLFWCGGHGAGPLICPFCGRPLGIDEAWVGLWSLELEAQARRLARRSGVV